MATNLHPKMPQVLAREFNMNSRDFLRQTMGIDHYVFQVQLFGGGPMYMYRYPMLLSLKIHNFFGKYKKITK